MKISLIFLIWSWSCRKYTEYECGVEIKGGEMRRKTTNMNIWWFSQEFLACLPDESNKKRAKVVISNRMKFFLQSAQGLKVAMDPISIRKSKTVHSESNHSHLAGSWIFDDLHHWLSSCFSLSLSLSLVESGVCYSTAEHVALVNIINILT